MIQDPFQFMITQIHRNEVPVIEFPIDEPSYRRARMQFRISCTQKGHHIITWLNKYSCLENVTKLPREEKEMYVRLEWSYATQNHEDQK